MTNYYENLDVILSIYRLDYLNAKKRQDWIEASQSLYDRNCSHPPDAFLKDMPKFILRANTLRAKIDLNMKAKKYCEYWNARLELAMSDFRKKNQSEYNRV